MRRKRNNKKVRRQLLTQFYPSLHVSKGQQPHLNDSISKNRSLLFSIINATLVNAGDSISSTTSSRGLSAENAGNGVTPSGEAASTEDAVCERRECVENGYAFAVAGKETIVADWGLVCER